MSEQNNDQELLKECKKKIKKIYELLLQDEKFETFAVSDILRRGKETIEAIRAEDELDLDELKVTNLSKLIKCKNGLKTSDPSAVCFQAKILIKLGKISFTSENNALVTLFEILLALAILFGADLKSKASETLLENCVEIIRSASE